MVNDWEYIAVSVESEVLAAMQAHVAARMNDDVDAVVSSYSDQWTDDKGGSQSVPRKTGIFPPPLAMPSSRSR